MQVEAVEPSHGVLFDLVDTFKNLVSLDVLVATNGDFGGIDKSDPVSNTENSIQRH